MERERDRNLPGEFLTFFKPNYTSFKCSFAKANKKSRLNKLGTLRMGQGEREKGNRKEAFYSRV